MSPEEYKTEYGEVDITSYIKVICKRKRLIIGLFLIAVILAGVYSFFVASKIYQIETSLEIGTIGSQTTDGVVRPIEEPVQIVGKIENDVYGVSIRERLKIEEGYYPTIKAENPKDTKLLIIKIISSQPESAQNILKEVNSLILEDHQEKIKIKKELLNSDISLLENNIKVLEKNIEKNIDRVKTKIESLKEEEKNLEAKVVALQKILPYQQDPGTQFALFDAKERLEKKKQEIENLYLEINLLEGGELKAEGKEMEGIGINIFRRRINLLRRQIDDIRATQVVKVPTISGSPVEPKPMFNIVIAGALGVFIGAFFALGKEWWEKSKI